MNFVLVLVAWCNRIRNDNRSRDTHMGSNGSDRRSNVGVHGHRCRSRDIRKL